MRQAPRPCYRISDTSYPHDDWAWIFHLSASLFLVSSSRAPRPPHEIRHRDNRGCDLFGEARVVERTRAHLKEPRHKRCKPFPLHSARMPHVELPAPESKWRRQPVLWRRNDNSSGSTGLTKLICIISTAMGKQIAKGPAPKTDSSTPFRRAKRAPGARPPQKETTQPLRCNLSSQMGKRHRTWAVCAQECWGSAGICRDRSEHLSPSEMKAVDERGG